ncbi:MAG: 4Fe-4S binding protein [Promethearchaeota archaeon]|nr:MAG: 4Fe-4S binding protein [Candidatus Lokiarchaeota archaeon]
MIFQKGPVQFEIMTAIPMFILWVLLISAFIWLLVKQKVSTKTSIVLYIVSIVIAGIILGGIPNAVMPIQQILAVMGSPIPLISIIPMIIILGSLLLSSVFIGRVFCGYACPVGALQELISKIQFKSNLKDQKKIKYTLNIPYNIARVIRWAFFILAIILAIVWSFALLQLINPFLGFSFFTNPLMVALIIPLVTLIIIAISSVFVYRPWCRLFCPFGALSSVLSRLSVFKLRRTDSCTNCGLCEKICPTQEAYEDSSKAECYYCNRCIEICPENAIEFNKK